MPYESENYQKNYSVGPTGSGETDVTNRIDGTGWSTKESQEQFNMGPFATTDPRHPDYSSATNANAGQNGVDAGSDSAAVNKGTGGSTGSTTIVDDVDTTTESGSGFFNFLRGGSVVDTPEGPDREALREKVEGIMEDPKAHVDSTGTKQAYTAHVVGEDELLDTTGNQLADRPDLVAEIAGDTNRTAVERSTAVEALKASDPVSAAIMAPSISAEVSAAEAAASNKTPDILAAEAEKIGSTQAASDVQASQVTAETIAAQDKIQAAVDVQVAAFQAALVDPNDLSKAIDKVAELEPMKAASMASHMDGLLEGMESGNVPLWARPAVTKVEQMLASRGISASSVGRDSLFNAIIQSAMPIAQQDAAFEQDSYKTTYQSKVQAVMSDVNMEFAAKQFNASSINQTNQFRANLQAQVDMQNASRKDAMSQFNTQVAQQTAEFNASSINQTNQFNSNLQAQVDMSNATRQDNMSQFNAQTAQSDNQFNAGQINQTGIVNAQLTSQESIAYESRVDSISQLNAQLASSNNQFNASQMNAITQMQAQLDLNADTSNASRVDAVNQLNAQLSQNNNQFNAGQLNELNKFFAADSTQRELSNVAQQNAMVQANAQLVSQRDQFNANMASQLEQSNVTWRRQVNSATTAGENAVNQANAQNAFNLSNQALTFLWQEMRDYAQWENQASESDKDRRNTLEASVLANEAAMGSEIGSTIEALIDGTKFLQSFLK